MGSGLRLYVISHTHWDREWYQTFQAYRKRLVFMMDELIEHMENDRDYRYFHMDGQTIMLEDYLQIRPENEKRLRDLVREGRIIIGPWYVMPDEFLVSGESLVRNLQKGFEVARSWGVEPMKNGYVVDVFGHNAQFPQILRGFGIDSAVVVRGIGDYRKDTFIWTAPDGSRVLCIKLDPDRTYSNFYFAIRCPFDGRQYEEEELVARMKDLLEYNRTRAVSRNMIMMDGVDHMEIEPGLSGILATLNRALEGVTLSQSTLEEFVAAQRSSGAALEEVEGELYEIGKRGVNNAVLKNVLSSMVHLKQANNECEILLTRWAEPFSAAAGSIRSSDHKGFFREAWRHLLQNHPHDSICGCSITSVHQDNEYRFNQARYIAEETLRIGLEAISSEINTGTAGDGDSLVLFNASQQDFGGVVEAEIELPSDSPNSFRMFSADGKEVAYQLLAIRSGARKLVTTFRRLPAFRSVNYCRVAFPAFLPAVGYNTYRYKEYRNSPPDNMTYAYAAFHAPARHPGSMQTGPRSWENGCVGIHVQDNGAIQVANQATGKEYRDLLLFEDCADVGDGWNYRKPAMDSRCLSLNGKADFAVECDGPFKVRMKLTHTMDLPNGMHGNGLERSRETSEFRITTSIEMKKGSSLIECTTVVENNVREHRLRVLFPTYMDTGKYYTSTPFWLQERPVRLPDTHDYMEEETGVFPNQGIILIRDEKDSLGLYNKGLYEVAVSEDASRTIALTLFRSFSNEVGRDQGEMSLMERPMRFEYALDFGSAGTPMSHQVIRGDQWRTGVRSMCTDSHEGRLDTMGSFLRVNAPGVMLSAFRAGKDDMKIVRIYNCAAETASGNIELPARPERAFILDLNDEILEDAELDENTVRFSLKPAGILTIGFISRPSRSEGSQG